MVGDAALAEETAAVLGDEQVVLNADSTEVLVGLQLLVVEELLAMSLGPPLVNEGRNEIDAWLIGNDKAFLPGLSSMTQQTCVCRRSLVIYSWIMVLPAAPAPMIMTWSLSAPLLPFCKRSTLRIKR